MSITYNFNQAHHALLRRTGKAARKSIICALSLVGLFGGGYLAYTRPPSPTCTMVVGGYKEYDYDSNQQRNQRSVKLQAKYLKDKAELDAAIEKCVSAPDHCNHRVREFANMIEKVKEISDPLVRAEVINAFINNAIQYDSQEVKKSVRDTDHLSLLPRPTPQNHPLVDGVKPPT